MGVPFSWNSRSPSDQLSSKILMTVLLVQCPVECSRFLGTGFSVTTYCAMATTAVTGPSLPVKGGFMLLRKASNSLGSDNLAVITLFIVS